jgi:hypothetical protein
LGRRTARSTSGEILAAQLGRQLGGQFAVRLGAFSLKVFSSSVFSSLNSALRFSIYSLAMGQLMPLGISVAISLACPTNRQRDDADVNFSSNPLKSCIQKAESPIYVPLFPGRTAVFLSRGCAHIHHGHFHPPCVRPTMPEDI